MQPRYELDPMTSPFKSSDRSTPNSASPCSSRTHTRSQSATTRSSRTKTNYFDRNDGGWLESSPVPLSASTSHSFPLQHSPNELDSKDRLRSISDHDILKLTQLTNKLPTVSTKHNHIQRKTRHRHYLVDDELFQQSDNKRHVSPVSDTEDSAFLTIPSCNRSTTSTDTDDSQFSWHHSTPLLRKTQSEQTTLGKMRYHPLTVSTTALYSESDLTTNSSHSTRLSKRRSWYRSLMKRKDSPSDDTDESPIDSRKHRSIHRLLPTRPKRQPSFGHTSSADGRRHSFDDLRVYDPHGTTATDGIRKNDSSVTQLSSTSSAASTHSSLLAPSFAKENDSTHSLLDPMKQDDKADGGQPVIEITPALQQQEERLILYFDYDSLPRDNRDGEPQGIKALVKSMIGKGYGKMTETLIKMDNDDDSKTDEESNSSAAESEDHVDTEKGKEHYPTLESTKVIGGDTFYAWLNKRRLSNWKTGTRRIAEVRVAAENDTGLFKLTQLAEETMLIKGRLLNLYVSFLVPDKTEGDMTSNHQETSILDQIMNDRLLSLDPFIDDAKLFLNQRTRQLGGSVLMGNTKQQQPDQYRGSRKKSDSSSDTGNTSSRSSFSSVSSLITTSPSKTQERPAPIPLSTPHSNGSTSTCLPSLWNYMPCQQLNTYDCRQEQLYDAISDLRRGMEDFKRSLKDTENKVHGFQMEMNSTKTKMDIYLKDVPETHYSELKRLEIGIESIVANRAKSRGMELLYWLLTALLTGCAFLLWAVICVLKLGQSALSFPGKMIKTFNDHMEERNQKVKQAELRTAAKGAERPGAGSDEFGAPTAADGSLHQSSSSYSSVI